MKTEKFGVAIVTDLIQELDEMKTECDDLGATRSEIVEAIITIYFQADLDPTARVRELIIRRGNGNL